MNSDELIERIHNENATLRRTEHHATHNHSKESRRKGDACRLAVRVAWRIAIPAAAAAAILLIVLLPRERTSDNTTYASAGIYCNSQCNPDDVLALIDNNINHIRTFRKSSAMPSLLEHCRDEVTSSKITIQSL